MKNIISINKYLMVGLIIAALVGGSYMGYHYTKEHYEAQEEARLTKEEEVDRKNLICEARLQRGGGEIKSEYFIFERSAERKDCEKFIEYKNIPDDTEGVWMGF